ncbi:SymE family type I addiction module toxin [Pectobacterium wasabiae]|uniref:SymE family type I addiction module toxin n=1 Tax=Pectobacterium wasabiae TaxID=55208 RepID=UPI0008FBA42F|nr:SymE family type I addiction module toxin [Pectobacterium wasabiae]
MALWLYPASAINTARSPHHSNDAGRPNPSPSINHKGRWLEECGFISEMPVIVTVERGKIIIET